MGMTVRQFIESLTSQSILSAGDLSSVRSSSAAEQPEADAEALIRTLIEQGKLTKFQAINLYQGRAKGLIFGEYIVLDKLGAGGMGQVYKAQHRRMKRIVALKVLPPHAVGSAKAVQRFYQEVEVAAKLTHPNIVTAYDAGEARGLHFLVMEFVEGQDLSSYLSHHGPLGVEQALNVIVQAARGLAYAHGLGIIHRDIKPANLLITKQGIVKVLDMGLARIDNPLADASDAQDELTASGEVMGTVDYMSPEQAQDTRSADHRSDIYALGCTLYKLLTGKAPFPGDTTIKKILAHREQPIPSLRAARPEVPDMVDRMYQKMLAKNMAERTSTMTQVVSSLEKMLSGVDDERSSIIMTAEEPAPDEINFNFLQTDAGASNVLPGASALGPGPEGSQASGSKSSGVHSGGAASSGEHRALPPSVGSNGNSGAISTTAGAIPEGTVFPSVPAVPKIAKAKRLESGETDRGPPVDATDKAAVAIANRKRAIIIGTAAGALVAVGIAALVLSNSRSESEPEANPFLQAAAPAAAKPTPSAKPLIASPTIPSAAPGAIPTMTLPVPRPTSTLPEFPTAPPNSPAMLFGIKNAPPPAMNNDPAAPAPATPVPQAPKPVTPSPPLTEPKELLPLVDPAKHGQHGHWKRDADAVFCEVVSGPYPRMIVPFIPPEEYDLTCTVQIESGGCTLGLGCVFGGRQILFTMNETQAGLANLDGVVWYSGNNPTAVYTPVFKAGETATLQVAVRNGRIFGKVNDKPLVDFIGPPSRFTSVGTEWSVPPGQLFFYGQLPARFTRLTIGPPAMKLPPAPAPVNVAAAFDKTQNGIEGEFIQSRGDILINHLPGKSARLSFPVPHEWEFVVRMVVERRAGEEYLALGLPLGARRVGVIMDWTNEKVTGLQFITGGGANINTSGRRPGMLFTSGSLHVVRLETKTDPKGRRFRLNVDGREILNYACDDYQESGETQIPDSRAFSLTTYSSGWRIARFDVLAVGDKRLPIPSSAERARAQDSIRNLWAQADAKNAPLDGKLLVVDQLRSKAAEALDDPAMRYTALEHALRIAADAGDLAGAYEAAEDWYLAFNVERRMAQKRVIDAFKTPRPQTAAKQKLLDESLKLMERAARSEEFEWALEMAGALEKFLGTAAADVKREIRARVTEYALAKSLQDEAEAASAGAAESKDAAAQAAAHTALGRYRCFALNDWSGGLPELEQGDDAGFKAAAALETGELKTGEQQLATADKWWELSEKEKNQSLKWVLMERAGMWYRRAVPLLPAKAKASLERRKTLLAQQRKVSNGAGGPRRPLDAVKIGDHWYKYFPSALDWRMAKRTCEQLGGDLLMIESPTENEAVARLLLQSAGGSEKAACWLGMNDTATEGTFLNAEGIPVNTQQYTNWLPGEPDNAGGVEDHGQFEAVLSAGKISSVWRDMNGDSAAPFICEWDH